MKYGYVDTEEEPGDYEGEDDDEGEEGGGSGDD